MLKQLFHIKNDSPEPAAQQVLSIQVGEKHCGIAITNKSADRLYELLYYGTDELTANPIPLIIDRHEELKNNFYKVLISFDYPQSILTPVQYFKTDDAGLLLRSLYGVNGTAIVVSEKVEDWDLYNLYAVPKELHEWTNRHFAAGNYWHKYSVHLKMLPAIEENGSLLVDFRTEDFTIIAAAGKKLLLAQTFPYSAPEDVLYQLLRISEQFGLSQETVDLSLSGLIDQQSALYKELHQYFIHLGFRAAGWNAGVQEFPSHFFTSLNDLARCAS